jgi:hypothetical protein
MLDDLGHQLDEKRNSAHELWVETELRLGRNAWVISEAYGLVADQPLWENLYLYPRFVSGLRSLIGPTVRP